jgi:D-alanine-D-alanine ligase
MVAMTDKLVVGVLFGGRSGEHEISVMSARSVVAALDPKKYSVIPIGITQEGVWLVGEDILDSLDDPSISRTGLKQVILIPDKAHNNLWEMNTGNKKASLVPYASVDVFFPVLHGTFGEDGTMQGLLELADVAYVGAGVTGSAVGMDKGVFKDVMRAIGIPTVGSIILLRSELEKDFDAAVQRAQAVGAYPLFIKPANLGSSVGISKCTNHGDLLEALKEAASFDRRILVEKGVNAREIEVSVLGNDTPKASMPGEILPSREFYSYESKYIDGTSNLLIPAPLPAVMVEEIQRMAIAAYKAVDCSGMARVDFFVERNTDRIFLNEINTIPGFTSISMYPKLWEASGISYSDLIDNLVTLALERKVERDRTERRFRSAS